MIRYILTMVFLVIGIMSCSTHDSDGVYYLIDFGEIDANSLPKNELVIVADGKVVWTGKPKIGKKYLGSQAYFPEDATVAYVYSGDILVATSELRGRKGPSADNFFYIKRVPDPRIYKPQREKGGTEQAD